MRLKPPLCSMSTIPAVLLQFGVLCSFVATLCLASFGDRLNYYQVCFTSCLTLNCSNGRSLEHFKEAQPSLLVYLGWDCREECKYGCQWDTINFLTSNQVGLSEKEIPQFNGKWTFIRVLGIQEPASTFFSLLNLMATYLAWQRYCRRILGIHDTRVSNFGLVKSSQQEPVDDPYFITTTISAILAMNAWLWSTVFHAHDFPFTEKLDYFSAFSVVLYSFYAIVIRVIEESLPSLLNPGRLLLHVTTGIPFVAYYAYHIHFLTYVHFDYGFNMKANLIAGVAGSILWALWSIRRLYMSYTVKNWFSCDHIWTCLGCILSLNAFLSLELLDFPPILHTFDAHSLWHAATITIPFFWFDFLGAEAAATGYKLISRTESSNATRRSTEHSKVH